MKEVTKEFGIDVNDGKFRCVNRSDHHSFYLYEFKDTKPASSATSFHFALGERVVPTKEILCDETQCLVTLDLEFTTVSVAEKAVEEGVDETAKITAKIAAQFVAKRLATEVTELLKATATTGFNLDDVLTQVDKMSSVPVTTIDIDAVPTADIKAQAVKKMLPAASKVPENMFSELILHQVKEVAERMGFIVASNTSVVGKDKTKPFSQYYKSRPDFVVYHPKQTVAWVIQPTVQADKEEMDVEQDNAHATISAGVAEFKLKVGDNLGQLLAGMEKVAGDVAYEVLRKDIPAAEKAFETINIYGLLCDFTIRECQVYKLELDFVNTKSTLSKGDEDVPLATAISRLIATLQSATETNGYKY